MDKSLALKDSQGIVPFQMSVDQLLERKKKIQELQSKVMRENIDFGIIPGCAKPSLLKPGAETLNVTFGLRPILDSTKDIVEKELFGVHKEFQVTIHILNSSGTELATGIGSCSTMETKFRYRNAEIQCPSCGKNAVIKGKKEYGGGWLCFKKKGGCGAKFNDGNTAIESQEIGKIEYDNPADYFNTCLKIAKKRALVDGVLNATAASHVFTQDIEDMTKEIIADAEFVPITQDDLSPTGIPPKNEGLNKLIDDSKKETLQPKITGPVQLGSLLNEEAHKKEDQVPDTQVKLNEGPVLPKEQKIKVKMIIKSQIDAIHKILEKKIPDESTRIKFIADSGIEKLSFKEASEFIQELQKN